MNETAPPQSHRRLRRRDLVLGSGLLAAALVAGKLVGRGVVGVPFPEAPTDSAFRLDGLRHLDAVHAATVAHAARHMLGTPGRAALRDGHWQPLPDIDALIGVLAPDQQRSLRIGLRLFEESTWGPRGFSALGESGQARQLAVWQRSRLGLRRSVWGFLYAGLASSFAQSPAGWAHMGYEGPNRSDGNWPGRPPGQSAAFVWAEAVP